MGLSLFLTLGIYVFMFRSRTGLHMRATVQNRSMSDAVGINTSLVDRFTFAMGCGIAGVAGAAFTTIGSTGPDSGSRYIVDTFLVVVFGGAGSMLGTIVSRFRHRPGAIRFRVLPRRHDGQGRHPDGHRRHPDASSAGSLPSKVRS
jgi:ABC-type branched-subunit amino acid transport system permease subunit